MGEGREKLDGHEDIVQNNHFQLGKLFIKTKRLRTTCPIEFGQDNCCGKVHQKCCVILGFLFKSYEKNL